MRLEAVIVGGVTDRARRARRAFERIQLGFACRMQRLLDQRVFAVTEQVTQDFDFRLVGRADQSGVVAIERHRGDVAPIRICRHRIDDPDEIGAGDAAALFALHAVSNNNYAHCWQSLPLLIDNS